VPVLPQGGDPSANPQSGDGQPGAGQSAAGQQGASQPGSVGSTGAGAGTSPVTAGTGPGVSDAAGTTPPTLPLATLVPPPLLPTSPVDAPVATPNASASPAPVSAQLVAHLAPLRHDSDGVQRLVVQLHPADLGAVQVVAELRNGRLDLQLNGSTEAGRDALRSALADLRRDLTGAGVERFSVDVGGSAADDTRSWNGSSRGLGNEQSEDRGSRAQQGADGRVTRGGHVRAEASTAETATSTLSSGGRGIDVRM